VAEETFLAMFKEMNPKYNEINFNANVWDNIEDIVWENNQYCVIEKTWFNLSDKVKPTVWNNVGYNIKLVCLIDINNLNYE